MTRYYLTTGLRGTTPEEFSSDKEAWEELRKLLPGKLAWLKKEVHIARFVDEPNYISTYQNIFDEPPNDMDFITIAKGITDAAWDLPDNLDIEIKP